MADEEDARLIPLNMKAMRAIAGPMFDEDSRAIQSWIHDGPEPDFLAIGQRLLDIHVELERRDWYRPDDFVTAARAAVRNALRTNTKGELGGSVARLVEITRGLLKKPPPRPPGRGGPKAEQMSLGKRRT